MHVESPLEEHEQRTSHRKRSSTSPSPNKNSNPNKKNQAKKLRGSQMWSAVVSQDIPDAASSVASFPALSTIPGSPSHESKAASTSTGSFHIAAVSPISSITHQHSVTSDQLSSLTDSIEAPKKENQKHKE